MISAKRSDEMKTSVIFVYYQNIYPYAFSSLFSDMWYVLQKVNQKPETFNRILFLRFPSLSLDMHNISRGRDFIIFSGYHSTVSESVKRLCHS